MDPIRMTPRNMERVFSALIDDLGSIGPIVRVETEYWDLKLDLLAAPDGKRQVMRSRVRLSRSSSGQYPFPYQGW